jgi:hypothetical protein
MTFSPRFMPLLMQVSELASPYSACTQDVTAHRTDCERACLAALYTHHCACVPPFIQQDFGPPCSLSRHRECVMNWTGECVVELVYGVGDTSNSNMSNRHGWVSTLMYP